MDGENIINQLAWFILKNRAVVSTSTLIYVFYYFPMTSAGLINQHGHVSYLVT
jgi:hypothetical protein